VSDNTTTEKRKKVAIVGKAPSSLGFAPYDDDTFEIWTLSDLVPCGQAKRYDRHFELHPVEWFEERATRGCRYLEWMQGIDDKPLYLRQPHDALPNGVLFPKEAVVEKFGTYFTNTVSWMIAFAIYEGFEEIHVYGVDMACDDEYAHQRPSCEYFLGWAAGAGIKIYLPPESDLLKSCSLYGFEADNGEMRALWKARDKELRERIGKYEETLKKTELEYHQLIGALNSQTYYKQWIPQ